MAGKQDNKPELTKEIVFQKEYEKMTAIFCEVEEPKRKLVEGLIEDAAFLYAENWELRKLIKQSGTVRVHPQKPELQKPVPAATQYLKNTNSYSVIIKALGSVLNKNIIAEDDDMEEFE